MIKFPLLAMLLMQAAPVCTVENVQQTINAVLAGQQCPATFVQPVIPPQAIIKIAQAYVQYTNPSTGQKATIAVSLYVDSDGHLKAMTQSGAIVVIQ